MKRWILFLIALVAILLACSPAATAGLWDTEALQVQATAYVPAACAPAACAPAACAPAACAPAACAPAACAPANDAVVQVPVRKMIIKQRTVTRIRPAVALEVATVHKVVRRTLAAILPPWRIKTTRLATSAPGACAPATTVPGACTQAGPVLPAPPCPCK